MKRTTIALLILLVCALLCILLPSKKKEAPKFQKQLSNKEIAILELSKLDCTSTIEKWLDIIDYCRDSDKEVSKLALDIVKTKCHQDDITVDYITTFADACIADLDYDKNSYSKFATEHPFLQIIDHKIATQFLYYLMNCELIATEQEALLRLIEHYNNSDLFFSLSLDDEKHFSLITSFDKFSIKGKATCLHFLGMFKDSRSIELIVKCCLEENRDPNLTEVTLAAVSAAGEIGIARPDLIEALEKRLHDWKISVVIESIRSLMKIKNYDAVPILSKMLVEQSNFVATQEILTIFKDLPNDRLVPARAHLQEFVSKHHRDTQDSKLLLRDMPNAIELAEIMIERSMP